MDPRSRSDDGFTIIEVIIASTVLVGALLAAAAMFSNAILVSGNTRNRVVAANLATAQMEDVRGQAADPTQFTSIPQGQTTYTTAAQLVNGIQYTVKQNVQFVAQSSSQSSCDSPGTQTGQIMQVSESVTWASMGGTKPVKEVTTLAPPVGAYSASAGAIAAKVFDSTGAVSENVTVQINGPTSATEQTTTEGCAYFAYLTPGAYTVSISGTGVGDQELATPTQNASVSVGQTVSIQFQYDNPATITATFPTTPVPATGMSLSVANTGLQPYGQFTFASAYTAGATVTSPNLFPYASGYTLFAGNCTDNNPLGKDLNHTALYPTAAPPVITVTPNGTANAGTVPLYSVAVHVQNTAAPVVAVANTTPTAVETTSYPSPYTAQCTNGTASGSAATLGMVTTNATGDSTTLLPLGHWTIKATCTKPAAACPSANKSGSTNVWVKPDGVYQVNNATGASTTKFPAAVTVPVT